MKNFHEEQSQARNAQHHAFAVGEVLSLFLMLFIVVFVDAACIHGLFTDNVQLIGRSLYIAFAVAWTVCVPLTWALARIPNAVTDKRRLEVRRSQPRVQRNHPHTGGTQQTQRGNTCKGHARRNQSNASARSITEISDNTHGTTTDVRNQQQHAHTDTTDHHTYRFR